MGFGIAAVTVGGIPGMVVITTMIGIEAYNYRKIYISNVELAADDALINLMR